MRYIESFSLNSAPRGYDKIQIISAEFSDDSVFGIEYNRHIDKYGAKKWNGKGYHIATASDDGREALCALVCKEKNDGIVSLEHFREAAEDAREFLCDACSPYKVAIKYDETLNWNEVRKILHEVFGDTKMEFVVYRGSGFKWK